jgi:hypothetical protein
MNDLDRAVTAANATVHQINETPAGRRTAGVPPWQAGHLLQPGPAYSWRTTGDPGLMEIWHHGQAVGTVALLPGFVARRAVLMDLIIDHLNHPQGEQQ